MHRNRLVGVAVALALVLGAAACGSADKTGAPAGGTPGGAEPGQGKQGGTLTVLAAGDVDYVDPGQVYYAFGYMVHYAVNRTLYSYGPGDDAEPRADLATGEPQVSADKRTVTVKLKRGVRYAPPVDREVTAADVKYAFERAFSAHVPSSYAGVYFKDIVGAPVKPGAIKDIPGIEVPDDQTIVFRLSRPSAALLVQAIAMPISTPVPREYAARFDAKTPSTYDQHVAFTGPYMYAHDASGKLTGRKPGQSIKLVRNPNWDARTDYRPAYLDEIDIQEGNTDAVSSGRRVLSGSHVIQGDGTAPAPVIKQALSRSKDQIAFIPGGGYRMIAMNSAIEPFGSLDVRRAVLAASDRTALQLTRGGTSAGDLASHFLPPGFPGFEEAGGMRGTGADFLADPRGDMALAKRYMLAAKRADPGLPISAAGLWTGREPLLMVATNADPGKKTAEVALDQFEKLGFKIKFRAVPQDTLYTKFCNVPKAEVVICPNVGFFKDFNDPQALLDPVFNGKNILPANNSNWSQLDDPDINAAMARAAQLDPGPQRSRAWGEIDAMITRQAPAIPYLWDKIPTVKAADVRGVVNEYATSWDLSFTSLR